MSDYHSTKGRMGLHYAAAIADHDDRGMYDWLTDEFSADEGKLDKVIDKLMSLRHYPDKINCRKGNSPSACKPTRDHKQTCKD